uniref:Uncharacterized protein n=1 Tax=viral metagenome TaxID=1070528 RepID=A0A6C0LFZ7_9ZZZZ
MYVLYLSTLSFILFTLYNCFSDKRNKNLTCKKLDDKNNYSFIIKNIEFFKNGKCVELKNYNNYYFKQNNIELNVNFIYDFFVVNYIYNNTEYKYYSENGFLTFPMYSSEQIKNYVYINKISSAKLLVTETDNNKISVTDEIDILPMLIPFIGPNYNFYEDLEYIGTNVTKLNVDKILTYLKCKNENTYDKLDTVNKNYKLLFYDNFNNEYNIDSNYLRWNPELKL